MSTDIRSKCELAWNYAYFYFKEYPRPFPWHLEKIWPSLEKTAAVVCAQPGRSHEI